MAALAVLWCEGIDGGDDACRGAGGGGAGEGAGEANDEADEEGEAMGGAPPARSLGWGRGAKVRMARDRAVRDGWTDAAQGERRWAGTREPREGGLFVHHRLGKLDALAGRARSPGPGGSRIVKRFVFDRGDLYRS